MITDPVSTDRAIESFRQDDEGTWIAELTCGHHQHVRHAPPLQPNEWVLDAEGRFAKLDTPLRCRLCDQAILPERITFLRRSMTFEEGSAPRGLQRRHRMEDDAWGVLQVERGRLGFRADTDPMLDLVVEEGSSQGIPPGVEHEVHLLGPVRFSIEYYAITPDDGHTAPSESATF